MSNRSPFLESIPLGWLASIAAVLLVFFTGCGDEPSSTDGNTGASESRSGPPERGEDVSWGETLRRRLDVEPATLCPLFVTADYEYDVLGLIHDSLWNETASMQAEPSHLVESVSLSEDKLTVTVRLSEGNTWHDGQPFSAHDVAFSYRAYMGDEVQVRSRPVELAAVNAKSDLEVEFQLHEPSPSYVWDCTYRLIPRHLYEPSWEKDPTLAQDPQYAELARSPVGLGPYRLASWEEGRLHLKRWDDYRGAIPFYDEVVYEVIKDAGVALQAFQAGKIDAVTLDERQWADAHDNGTLEGKAWLHKALGNSSTVVCWNVTHPFLADARVRRAMAMAIDLDRVNEQLGGGLLERSTGPWYRGHWAFDATIPPYVYDLEKVEALLDEAGFGEDEASGQRKKGDVAAEFTLLLPIGISAVSEACVQLLKGALEKVGVVMIVEPIEFRAMLQRGRKHEFEALITGFTGGADPASVITRVGRGQSSNFGLFDNDEVESLLARGAATFDRDQRAVIYRELQRVLHQEQPYLFLFAKSEGWALHNKIRGVVSSPKGPIHHFPGNLGWWTLLEDHQTGDRLDFDGMQARMKRPFEFWGSR